MFLLWSHVFSMHSLQISVLFVLMRVEISLFSLGILGSCGVFLLVKFLCAILLRMSCGRSLSCCCGRHSYTQEGSDNPISLEKPFQASLPPAGAPLSRESSRGPVCCLRYIGVCS